MLKLPEALFQPLYLIFLQWPADERKKQRLIPFFTCLNKLVGKLKSLFVPFVRDSLSVVIDTLTNSSHTDAAQDSRLGKENILKLIECVECLMAFFQYCDKAIETDDYEKITQPLIDLLGMDSVESIDKLVSEHVIPCIAQMASANSEWKTINDTIILKAQGGNSQLQINAMHCLLAMAEKLEKDYLTVIPETMPLFAELMEDSDNNVVKQCHMTLQKMEKAIGESLQVYL